MHRPDVLVVVAPPAFAARFLPVPLFVLLALSKQTCHNVSRRETVISAPQMTCSMAGTLAILNTIFSLARLVQED